MLSHYIFVRRDLPLGMIAAMCTHAAGESAIWNPTDVAACNTRAVVLQAKDEAHLEKIRSYLIGENIPHVKIVEDAGRYAHQLMAIGVIPVEHIILGNKLADFTLLNSCLELDIPEEEE